MRKVLAFTAILATGCWAFMGKDEGEKMKTDLQQIKGRVDNLDQRDADLNQATKDAKEQVAKLKSVLEEATKVVTRNSADVGLQVQKLQQDFAMLMGKVDEISHNLDAGQKDPGAHGGTDAKGVTTPIGTPTTTAPETPKDKDGLFAAAQAKLASGDQEEARRLLRQFMTQYPRDSRVAQAQLMHGESYFKQKKYAAAIGEFQKVIDNYPKSSSVEGAMYKIGLSFFELHYCTDAKTFLDATLKRFPSTSHAKEIRGALATIQKNTKNSKVCSN